MLMRFFYGVIVVCSMFFQSASVQAQVVIQGRATSTLPAQASEAMTALLSNLQASGAAVSPDAVKKIIGENYPLPAAMEPTLNPQEILAQIETGYRLWLRGEFITAEQTLITALKNIAANPGLVVSDVQFRNAVLRGSVALSLSRSRLKNNTGATEAMTELIRTLPEQPVTKGNFGPEAEDFYVNTRRKLDSLPRGKMLIDVTRSDAQIFVNEQGRAKGSAFTSATLPGTYRIYVQVNGVGRKFLLPVKPNGEAKLTLEWDIIRYLTAADDGMTLVLPAAELTSLSVYASRYMKSIESMSVPNVIALQVNDKTIRGALIDILSGTELKSARIKIGPGAMDRAYSLAKFLTSKGGVYPDLEQVGVLIKGGATAVTPPAVTVMPPVERNPATAKAGDKAPEKPVPVTTSNVEDATIPESKRAADSSSSSSGAGRGWAYAAIGTTVVAAGAIGTGLYLRKIDGKENCDKPMPNVICKDLYDTKLASMGAIAGGVVMIGVTAYFVYRWQTAKPDRPVAALLPTGDGAIATIWGRF
jgi:hypothetical protein